MAWPEKTASGIWRIRETIRVDGKKKKFAIIKDLGTGDQGEKLAAAACVDYEKAKLQGYVWNPQSPHVLADIREFIRAKGLGIDPNEPSLSILAALEKFLAAKKLSANTKEKYRGAALQYLAHSKALILDDMTVDSVNAWREAMEDGTLTYARKESGKRYRFTETTVSIRLKDLRVFTNYCVFRGWMAGDPANKAKPLNPFAQIEVSDPIAVKRYVNRSEAARLLWACRLDKFKANGNAPIPERIRTAILGAALKHPEHGKWTVKRSLDKAGIKVGIGTIDWLWRRNGLSSERLRKKAAALPGPFVPATSIVKNKKANSKARKWLHFELYTGLRDGEARRARCEDIITHEVIDPETSAPRTVFGLNVLKPSKGGDSKVRIVWLPPNAATIHGLPKKLGKRGPLLPPLSKSGLSRTRRNAVGRAGLVRVRSHDMRHSFARNFLLSGGSLPGLQQGLGHSRLSTTGIYSNFANTDLAGSAKSYRVK